MELEFREPQLADRAMVDEYLRMNRNRSCEYTFANLYLWSRYYRVQYAIVENMLVFQYIDNQYFTFPQGDNANLGKTLDALEQWYRERNIEFHLVNVNPEQFELLEQIRPGQYSVKYDRDMADYVYEVEKLSALSGKKYHGKKNHVNKFIRLYPDWSYESITEDNVEECFQMALDWRRESGCDDDPEKNAEMCVTLNALRLREELGLRGGLIRAGGRVAAFTLGEPACDDTFVVHIEKAYADVEGAYTMINQQFLLHEGEGYTYVNREEDLGDPGLRQAKESYHPVFMVEKGIVSLNQHH